MGLNHLDFLHVNIKIFYSSIMALVVKMVCSFDTNAVFRWFPQMHGSYVFIVGKHDIVNEWISAQ